MTRAKHMGVLADLSAGPFATVVVHADHLRRPRTESGLPHRNALLTAGDGR